MTKKIIILVIVLLVTSGVGYAAGYSSGVSSVRPAYEFRLNQIKADFPSAPEIHSFSGVVKEVKGDSIVIKTNMVSAPWEPVMPLERTVMISSTSKLEKIYPRSAEELQKQSPPFPVGSSSTRAAPPPSFPEVKLMGAVLSDIKPGDVISLESSENAKFTPSFTASRILVTGHVVTSATSTKN